MLVQLTKWGNSLAVRIPAVYARQIGVSENSQAELSVADGKLVLTPVRTVQHFDLDVLVSQITDENRHDEVSSGPAVGAEFD